MGICAHSNMRKVSVRSDESVKERPAPMKATQHQMHINKYCKAIDDIF